MPESTSAQEKLAAKLEPVVELLRRHHLVETLVHRAREAPHQELVESIVHRQQLTELARRLSRLSTGDIAHLLEMLPPDERALVWGQVPSQIAGEVLEEVTDVVAEGLVELSSRKRLLSICRHMDADDLGRIAEYLSADILRAAYEELDHEDRVALEQTISYPDDSAGHLMSRDAVTVKDIFSVKDALKALRKFDMLPEQTDQLFVVDAMHRLKGIIPLTLLITQAPRVRLTEIMRTDWVGFVPEDDADAVAQGFERYDLVSAPVVNDKGRLLGRVTVEAVMDYVREQSEDDALRKEGLSGEEDLLGPIWGGALRRWLWLSINLMTAFIASRVISVFEGTIEQLVALAALMPIVASVGGNTGNQTVALLVRGLALDQISATNLRYIVLKEVAISFINGAVWGSVMGFVAFLLYQSPVLGIVMAAAMLLNLLVAAVIGLAVPILLAKLGRDPAMGSSVLLTFTTDSMGFFIFLGLAALFLLH